MAQSARYQKGAKNMEKIFGRPLKPGAMQGDFMKLTVENLFGDVWGRPGLKLEERSMITVAALAILGREAELKIHLFGARNLGISRKKAEEMMMHLAHYGGWPVAATGMRIVDEVYSKKLDKPTKATKPTKSKKK